jgi:hypothetical protein
MNCYVLLSCLVYSTLKMEATYSFETTADFQRSISRKKKLLKLQINSSRFFCPAINSFQTVSVTARVWPDLHTEFHNSTALKWKATRKVRPDLETCEHSASK